MFRRDPDQIRREAAEILRKYTQEIEEQLKNRIYRPVFGARISYDHGKTWKLRALCSECMHSFEPLVRCKNLGISGTQTCDFCAAVNEMYRK